jgi:2-oxoglutarate ferredoxin oxidoreductase subunit alpha
LRTDVKEGVDYHPYLPREDGRLPMSDFGGVHRYNVTGLYHDMWGFPSDKPEIVHGLLRHLVDKIENNATRMAHYNNYFLHDADTVLISYGSSARSALHAVRHLRKRGQRIGLLELQTLWPFPRDVVREFALKAKFVGVVEMNMGQLIQSVKLAVDEPDKVFLINRFDGELITDADIKKTLRIITGRGV